MKIRPVYKRKDQQPPCWDFHDVQHCPNWQCSFMISFTPDMKRMDIMMEMEPVRIKENKCRKKGIVRRSTLFRSGYKLTLSFYPITLDLNNNQPILVSITQCAKQSIEERRNMPHFLHHPHRKWRTMIKFVSCFLSCHSNTITNPSVSPLWLCPTRSHRWRSRRHGHDHQMNLRKLNAQFVDTTELYNYRYP